MKNCNVNWRKNCLCLTLDETVEILKEIYGIKDIVAHPDLDGLWFSSDDDEEWNPDDYEICDRLSDYFDIKVTSIHIDDCDMTGVWIVYR